jgi:hypothetical protein
MEVRWMDGLSIAVNAVPAHVAALLNLRIRDFYSGIRPLQGEERDAAVAEFKHTLRGLVDQWIDSGRTNKTVTGDDPLKRSIIWRSPLHPTALFETLAKFWAAQSARMTVELNGSLVAHIGPPESARAEDALRWARERAIFEFARLLDSPSPQRLSLCSACGRYFVRQRTPRKPIYHGTFCGRAKCKNGGSANRVRESRRQQAQDKICWAADALVNWQTGNRHGDKKDWIREKVNERLKVAGVDQIEINWVTWHLKETEAEVERRKRAKG